MFRLPTKKTLDKYGLTYLDWLGILMRQGDVCAICKKMPTTGSLCIEHEHVKGWSKMPPEQRKLYVRGLCCYVCNTQYLGRGLTIEKARNVVTYLEEYYARRPATP